MNAISQISQYKWLLRNHKVQVLLGTIGLAITGNIYIEAIVVPMSMQTFGVMLLAFLLPKKQALQAVALYLLAGSIGIPVFAKYRSGLDILLGSNCGYFLGFVLCIYIISSLKQRFNANKTWQIMLYSTLGTVTIWICGATWLSFLIGFTKAIEFGVTPFLLGGLLKIALITTTLKIINNFGSKSSQDI